MASEGTVDTTDQQDFWKRLGRYKIAPQSVTQTLVVREKRHLALSRTLPFSEDPCSPRRPNLIKLHDIDALTEMLGLPEGVLAKNPSSHMDTLSSWKPSAGTPQLLREDKSGDGCYDYIDFKQIPAADLAAVQTAVRAYGRGHAKALAKWKPLIEAYLRQIDFTIAAWAFRSVTIEAGAVLEFDNSANVLAAYKVTIHDTGQIRSAGELTINCTILEKV